MYEEFLEHINGLIYYGFFYKQDSTYADDIIETIKLEIEKEIDKKLEWEDIKHNKLEEDILDTSYDQYYTEKEFNQILKTIKIDGVEDIKVDIDIEDYKRRVVNSFMSDGIYTEYLKTK